MGEVCYKADLDFPNDLLNLLDKPHSFPIRELGNDIKVTAHPDFLPIIIITSNKERGSLPAPFLRRCVYHYASFPDETRLKEIIALHLVEKKSTSDAIDKAIKEILQLREKMEHRPGTSEILDWMTYAMSREDETPMPLTHFTGLLVKTHKDWQKLYQGQ